MVNQLKLKEIKNIINILEEMQEYKMKTYYYGWEYSASVESFYIIKLEILVIWKLCMENGINIDFIDLPEIDIKNDDEFVDEYCDIMYDLEASIESFVFQKADYMLDKGWEIHSVCEDDFEEQDDDEVGEDIDDITYHVLQQCIATYGESIKILDNFIDCMVEVRNNGFFPFAPTLIKSMRVGKYLSYVDKNPYIKKTKQYEMIEYCLDTIKNPFELYISHFQCDKVSDDGCYYAFYTGGGYEDGDGSFISLIHTRICRCLCLELCDQLLTRAEKKYNL